MRITSIVIFPLCRVFSLLRSFGRPACKPARRPQPLTGIVALATVLAALGTQDAFALEASTAFSVAKMLPMPVHPNSVATGDLNQDGNLDLVVPSWSPNQLSVLLGDGLGEISSQAVYATGGGPRFAIVADLNGDGNDDVATANETSADIAIHFGNGSGTLQPPTRIAVGLQPYHLAAADLNADGDLDLIVANAGSGTISVLANSGTGVFSTPTSLAVGVSPHSVSAADFNSDGKLDIAVANLGSNNVSLLLGDGSGSFGPPSSYPVGSNPFTLTSGDFNADGRPDLAVPNFGGTTVSILLSEAGGGFGAAVNYAVGQSPRAAIAHDFDGDGDLDLSVANRDSNSVSFLEGDGVGGFVPVREFGIGSGPFSLAAGDLNSDGTPDVAVADRDGHTISILVGGSDFDFAGPEAKRVGRNPRGVAAADLNGDGYSDLVVANNSSNNISVMLGTGEGRLAPATNYAVAQGPYSPVVADLNSDGVLDIAVANASNNSISVMPGTRAGQFSVQQKYSVASGPRALATVDLNRDGRIDLVSANYNAGSVSVVLATSSGGFAGAVSFAAGAGASGIVAGDFNEDGNPDIAVTSATAHSVGILLGTGTGSLGPVTAFPCGNAPSAIVSFDYNSDGCIDLAVTNETANTVTVLRGTGNGTFSHGMTLPCGTRPLGLVVNELTGDGFPDIVVANASSNTVTIHEGAANGGFLSAVSFPAGPFSRAIAVADFNLDGRGDVAVGNSNADNVWCILSRGSKSVDLGLTVDNGVSVVAPGSSTTYSITVANHGPESITTFKLEIDGSVAFTDLEASPAEGAYDPVSGIWSGLLLEAGDTVVLSLQASLGESATGVASLSAAVFAGSGFADSIPANNTAADNDQIQGEISPPNAVPVADSVSVSLAEDSNVAVVLHATDADGDPIAYAIQQQPSHGTLSGVAPNLTYTPAANYFGPDIFTFSASDGKASGVGTVTISVTPTADLPTATGQSLITNEDSALPIILSANDTDGEQLTFTVTAQPLLGTISGVAPNFTYQPNPNVSGADGFSFTVSDGTSVSEQATVSILIAALNDAPVVAAPIPDQTLNGDGTTLEVNIAGMFADVESPSNLLAVTVDSVDPDLVSPVLNGSILQLQLAENRGGTTSIIVRATDPGGAFVEDTFAVSIIRPGVRVSVADANRGEGNSAGPVFTVTLSAPSTVPVTVTYVTSDLTAISGVDYISAAGTITFAPGVVSRTVSVKPIADTLDESNETFAFLLTSSTGGVLDDAEAIGTILDDDTSTLTVQNISIAEGDEGISTATFTVVLSTPSMQDVIVSYATASLSAGATVGVDYAPTSGTLTFPAGTNAAQLVTVDILNDLLDEGDEAFSFILSSAANATLGRAVARATVLDNDAQPSVSITDSEVVEGDAGTKSVDFSVSLSAPSGERTRIRYGTSDGSAVAGSDYLSATGELIFEPGVTTRTVTIQVQGDPVAEAQESFFLSLHTPTLLTLGDAQAIGSIVDNDSL